MVGGKGRKVVRMGCSAEVWGEGKGRGDGRDWRWVVGWEKGFGKVEVKVYRGV